MDHFVLWSKIDQKYCKDDQFQHGSKKDKESLRKIPCERNYYYTFQKI